MQNKITEETTLAEILSYPGAEKILLKYSVPCLHCPAAIYEISILKLGEVAETYGIDKDKLLTDLNKIKPTK